MCIADVLGEEYAMSEKRDGDENSEKYVKRLMKKLNRKHRGYLLKIIDSKDLAFERAVRNGYKKGVLDTINLYSEALRDEK